MNNINNETLQAYLRQLDGEQINKSPNEINPLDNGKVTFADAPNTDASNTASDNIFNNILNSYNKANNATNTGIINNIASVTGEDILNQSYRDTYGGSYTNIMQNFLTKLDRHGNTYIPQNALNYGFTFITRPRFNLTLSNLIHHPLTALLGAEDPSSYKDTVAFMIRMLLDTRISRGLSLYCNKCSDTEEDKKVAEAARLSGLVDINNPFFVPLCNGLKGMSGWPDFNLEVATMAEDFHSGDFTFIRGADMLRRTTELSLEFVDVQGSIILSCIFYWCLLMALQAKGEIMAYPDDIHEQRLNYTVSIYRFITDTTRRNILWWSKATGCFPKSAPIGQLFNINQGEVIVSSAKQFSVPFTVNNVEYNDPGILYDFRRLLRNYNRNFDDGQEWFKVPDYESTGGLLSNWNFIGLPDIENGKSGLELVWKTHKDFYSSNWPTNNIFGIN